MNLTVAPIDVLSYYDICVYKGEWLFKIEYKNLIVSNTIKGILDRVQETNIYVTEYGITKYIINDNKNIIEVLMLHFDI